MTKLIPITLLALASLATLGDAHADSSEEVVTECTSNAPAHVAEGTAVDHDGDARAEAERLAVRTATNHCMDADAGEPVFTEIDTRQSGAVATSTVRFVCSAEC